MCLCLLKTRLTDRTQGWKLLFELFFLKDRRLWLPEKTKASCPIRERVRWSPSPSIPKVIWHHHLSPLPVYFWRGAHFELLPLFSSSILRTNRSLFFVAPPWMRARKDAKWVCCVEFCYVNLVSELFTGNNLVSPCLRAKPFKNHCLHRKRFHSFEISSYRLNKSNIL